MPANLPFQESLSPEMILHIDGLCDQFESDLQAGRQPVLEQLLPAVAEEARPRLFREFLTWKFAIAGKADVR